MAQHQTTLSGDAESLLAHLDREIKRSISATVEDTTDQRVGDARMLVRSYERYSMWGGNRVSLTVSILAVGDALAVSLVTAGGSEAVFWKVNTIGENSFMAWAVRALESFTDGPQPGGGQWPDGAVV